MHPVDGFRLSHRHEISDVLEKKRGVEDRTYVGKIHDGRFYTMEEFKRLFKRDGTPRPIRKSGPVKRRSVTNAKKKAAAQPAEVRSEPENKEGTATPEKSDSSRYDALLVGEAMLIERIARQLRLRDDLASVWGEQAADTVISLATFFLTSGRNSVYLYDDWRRLYAAPFGARLTPKDITEFFEELGCRPNWEADFFKARLARLEEDEVFSYDATNIATCVPSIRIQPFVAESPRVLAGFSSVSQIGFSSCLREEGVSAPSSRSFCGP